MAKKKNSPKKHKFKHVEGVEGLASVVATTSQDVSTGEVSSVRAATTQPPTLNGRDFSYVKRDIRRIGVMVGTLVVAELVFYYVLEFTSAGGAIYHLAGA